jgi:hypothetical protein
MNTNTQVYFRSVETEGVFELSDTAAVLPMVRGLPALSSPVSVPLGKLEEAITFLKDQPCVDGIRIHIFRAESLGEFKAAEGTEEESHFHVWRDRLIIWTVNPYGAWVRLDSWDLERDMPGAPTTKETVARIRTEREAEAQRQLEFREQRKPEFVDSTGRKRGSLQ